MTMQTSYKKVFFQHIQVVILIAFFALFNYAVTSSSALAQNNTPDTTANAAEETLSFKTDKQRKAYGQLIIELRCPKCQNQNIADSNADIAQDLRKKVYEMVLQDKSKTEIKQFMLDRYGEFVLYRPQFSGKTLLLWIGPVILLFAVIFFVIRIIARNASYLKDEDGEEEVDQV